MNPLFIAETLIKGALYLLAFGLFVYNFDEHGSIGMATGLLLLILLRLWRGR